MNAPEKMLNDALAALRVHHKWPDARPDVPEQRSPGGELFGWFHHDNRMLLSTLLSPETKLVVELGAFMGLSTKWLADAAPNATIITIDHWEGSSEHQSRPDYKAMLGTLFETFCAHLWDYRDRVIPMRLTTIRGLLKLRFYGISNKIAPQVVYIDASHETGPVFADTILAAELWPRAHIVGDDGRRPSIIRALADIRPVTPRQLWNHGIVWEMPPQGETKEALPYFKRWRRKENLLASSTKQVPAGGVGVANTIDIALVTWPNHPKRFEYLQQNVQSLKTKLTASRHKIRFFCSAETEVDPKHKFFREETEQLCRENDIVLKWRDAPCNLGANMNAAIAMCSGPFIIMQQDDWYLTDELDLSPSADLLAALPIDMFFYAWPRGRMSPKIIERDGWRQIKLPIPSNNWDKHWRAYQDTPHLRRRDFMDEYGWYLEGVRHGCVEGGLAQLMRSRFASVAIADKQYYKHIGQVSSVINDVRIQKKGCRGN